jgi:type I restriction enzyme, S subunit
MGYEPYPNYAASAAFATSQMPAHWTSKRIRFLCTVNPARDKSALGPDAFVSFVPMDAVGEHGGLTLTSEKQLDEIGNGYTYFADGDVVIAKITPCFENGKGALAANLTNGVAFGTTELHVVRSGPEIDPRFIFYISISDHFRKTGESEMYGAGGQKRIPETFIKDFMIAFPHRDEQITIANYLDRKLEKIDAVVANKRRLLELLEEQRLAVITHSITRGLNSSAQMKDSFIEWLGPIPAHWSLKKIKYMVSRVVDCIHTTPHYDGDLMYPAVRTADVERGRLLLNQVRLVSEEVYLERIARLRPIEGDILYSREGERFGLAALVPRNLSLCLGQRMMMFRALPAVNPAYLMWALNSAAIFQQVVLHTGGSTSPHVNIGDIINFFVPCPPAEEQNSISRHIETQCSKIDALAAEIRLAVGKLAEYRSALITDAVTGNIDVREAGKTKREVAAA